MTPEEHRERGTRVVALVLVDNAGIARMKCVSIDRLLHAAEVGVGWSEAWGLSLADDSFVHDPDLQPSHWAGIYACWGNENREAALRLEGAGGPPPARSANVEWKSVDCAANPYLALGGLIAAGLDGLARDLRLPPPVEIDPADFTEAERRERMIRRLPQTLEDATTALLSSEVLRRSLGPYLHDRIVAVRRAEAAAATDLDEEVLVARDRWRY